MMIVPADREYATVAEVEALRIGDKLHVDSGMGGSWELVLRGRCDGRLYFERPARPDWPSVMIGWTAAEAAERLYRLVPERWARHLMRCD
ncbi:MAG: hypothetical protein GX601_09160 [Anaerolineales bacterium]|nr:hypothetical protein [Anaerolineales bacterium]